MTPPALSISAVKRSVLTLIVGDVAGGASAGGTGTPAGAVAVDDGGTGTVPGEGVAGRVWESGEPTVVASSQPTERPR